MVDEVLKSNKVNSIAQKQLPSDPTTTSTAMSLEASTDEHFVRQKLETFRASMLRDFERRFSSMIDELLQDLRRHELQAHEFRHFADNGKYQTSTRNMHTWHNRRPATSNDDASAATTAETSRTQVTQDVIDSKTAVTTAPTTSSAGEGKTTTTTRKRRTLPEKVFVARESYLTALLQVDHMKTIYHIFYIILIMFLLNTMCYDFFVEGRINFGLGTFKSGLKRIHWVFGVWLLEHVFVFMLYYAFSGWAHVRSKLKPNSGLRRFWSHSCLILYISSQLVFSYVASALCLRFDLPFVSASVLLLESTRLLMKMHAFVRYNTPRVLQGKLKSDADADIDKSKASRPYVPPFRCYLYFLFAPTLVYRDSYPRTTHIRWQFALNRFLEVVAVAFLYSFIHERHIRAHFGSFGREEMSASVLIVKLFGMVLPSVVIFLCGFYLILHAWLNFTSELLRFGDRMFYKDWWTSHTYDAYYRNWNVVVHDWLYEYVYKDFYTHIFKGSKVAASLMVFLISALVHEQVLGFALQLFFPVMFVTFGILGVALVYLMRKAPKNFGNLFLWFSLIFGNATLISLYSMEYYARQNCPSDVYGDWRDYAVPAVWSCYRA